MSELINKIKSWFTNLKTSKISFEKKGIRPKNDWIKLLFISNFIVIVLAGISFYFYIKVDNGTFFSAPDSEDLSEVKINNTLLNKIIEDINTREKNLMEIKSSKDIPANPSL